MHKQPEVWLRGPLPAIPALLQPVAHALLQAREELNSLMTDFPDQLLWQKVAGLASPGFHLQHLTGVLDRLFTYAQNKALSDAQLEYLDNEGKPTTIPYTATELTEKFNQQIAVAMHQLSIADQTMLTDFRPVGRGGLPSTLLGLYVHSAEHTMRHLGQLLVTVQVLKDAYRMS